MYCEIRVFSRCPGYIDEECPAQAADENHLFRTARLHLHLQASFPPLHARAQLPFPMIQSIVIAVWMKMYGKYCNKINADNGEC